MKKYCLFFLLSLTQLYSNAQQYRVVYNLQNDKHWIDSIKYIIKKGYPAIRNKKAAAKQLIYFNSCTALGGYYEMMFKKKRVVSNAKAIYYYEKVSDFGAFYGEDYFYKNAAVKNNVCRKLAHLYYFGIGVKKSQKKSLLLALEGSSGVNGFYELYSKRYFGTTSIFLKNNIYHNFKKDTSFEFKLNPFAYEPKIYLKSFFTSDFLKAIKKYQNCYRIDTTLNLIIEANCYPSMISQAKTHFLLDELSIYLFKKYSLKKEKIITNNVVSEDYTKSLKLIITKYF